MHECRQDLSRSREIRLRAPASFRIPPSEGGTEIGRLSIRAIELAYSSAETDPRRLAAMLYFYNRIPVSRKWKERIPDSLALLRYLGIHANGRWPGSRRILPVRMKFDHSKTAEYAYWTFWTIRGGRSDASKGGQIKLYISPLCEDLSAVVQQLAQYLDGSGAYALKVGRHVPALLRPDKLMVYFRDVDDALRFGHQFLLRTCLLRAQGVPFTFPVGSTGLVSMGFDPPETARWSYRKEGGSWRLWVTGCVAETILRVRKSRSPDPMNSIYAELLARKIDPHLWKPLDGTWGAGSV